MPEESEESRANDVSPYGDSGTILSNNKKQPPGEPDGCCYSSVCGKINMPCPTAPCALPACRSRRTCRKCAAGSAECSGSQRR